MPLGVEGVAVVLGADDDDERLGARPVARLEHLGDASPADSWAGALAQLKKRGCKIIWLNPLKSWQDYQPIAKGMAAALPYLDGFKSAGSLAELATLEPELARL